jgi:putative transcriptional regulator
MDNTNLTNHLLIAMPWMQDTLFAKTVIYLCEHGNEGSVGLIINQPMRYPLQWFFEQLRIPTQSSSHQETPLLFGGPVKPERGFVIHQQGVWKSSLILSPNEVTITTSNDIIYAIAGNQGPKKALVTLGYTAWSTQQLEQEIIKNIWLVCPYHSEVLYEVPYQNRWEYATSLLGIQPDQISEESGHA